MKNNPTPSDTYKVTLERLAHSGLRADQFTCARRLVANALQPLAWREFLTTARLKAPTGPDIFGVQQEIELLFFIRPDELQPDCEINFCDGYVSLKLTTLEGVELSGNVPVGREDVDPLDTPQQVKPEWMQFFIAHDSTLYSFSRLDTIPEARLLKS